MSYAGWVSERKTRTNHFGEADPLERSARHAQWHGHGGYALALLHVQQLDLDVLSVCSAEAKSAAESMGVGNGGRYGARMGRVVVPRVGGVRW